MYYAGHDLNNKFSLGMYSDYVYSSEDSRFITLSNAQVRNTPVVIYSIGYQQVLYCKRKENNESSLAKQLYVCKTMLN